MRILMISHAFPPTLGGVETHLWDLCRELSARGHAVQVLAGGFPSDERHGAVAVSRRPALCVSSLLCRKPEPGPGTDLRLQAALAAEVREVCERFAPGVVHVHNAHHFAPELALACFEVGAVTPLLNSVHDRVGEALFPSVLQLPWAHTLYASHYLAGQLPARGPSSVLHLGLDLDDFHPRGPPHPFMSSLPRPVLFHPARLLRWKGVLTSVEAFIALRQQWGSGTLVLCGSRDVVDDPVEGSELRAEIERTAGRAGLPGDVVFAGFSRPEMPAAYRGADVVWYPTIDEEPLGLVPLEAMACGRPVVVSDSGGMRETVLNDLTGRVVARGDALALASATRELLGDEALRARLVAGGLERAATFDLRRYTTALESLYADCLT